MRPTRLELSGFASFRDPCVVDFADADLFVLSGATGAGKSALVDAMIFCLYGAVPRYGDRRRVEPVINKTADEARVRLDFTVEGVAHTAVRVVRRTATGATTKEARLEQTSGGDARTLAGTADEVSARVERLLGLSFEHFTTCVVLPQGEFQRFLHATGKERQDLLVELLDLDVYREIGKRARARAVQAASGADSLQRRLDGELAGATDDARRAAAERVDALAALAARIAAAQPDLEAIREEGAQLRAAQRQVADRRDTLATVVIPDGVEALGARLTEAGAAVIAAEQGVAEATAERDAAEKAEEALVDPALLRELAQLIAECDTLDARLQAATNDVGEAVQGVEAARATVDRANADLAAARARLDHARRSDLAATLAAGLHAGDDCPVCARPLDEQPDLAGADALAGAEQDVTQADRLAQQAAARLREVEAAHVAADTTRDGLAAQRTEAERHRDELCTTTGLAADPTAVAAALEGSSAARDRVVAVRKAERTARTRRGEAVAARDRLAAEADEAWKVLDAARDRVAALEPPPVDRDDLQVAWSQIAAWAQEQAPRLDEAVATAQRDVDDAVGRWRERQDELRRACADAGLDGDGDPTAVCATALANERTRLAHIDDQIEQASKARAELAELRHDERVARSLGEHLHATRFERWLLNRALRLLVVGASTILHELSAGAYSLALDDSGAFSVVDHRNVDTHRSARTLSGGETFLASLALALALAEHVADFAAHGSARLESLFLDEGFGTLDAVTLDTVASAIEELGARGRMVGLITHVRELAERMPLRYEVTKVGGCSQVVRVEPGQPGEIVATTTAKG